MTEELKAEELKPASGDNSHIEDPMERAKANGYVEPEEPAREDRVKALIKRFEHVKHHNSPIANEMMVELKALLGAEDEPKPDEATAEEHHKTDAA